MKKIVRKYAKDITVSKARNVFEVATFLHDKGHRSIIMVVGSDRVDEFDRLLNQYNGVKGRHGYYRFDNIEVVSAGDREPDAEGVEGMSASKMRAAAADGDKDSFLTGLPSGFRDGEKLYRDVRKYMGIREERDMGDMTDFENVRDMFLTGKIWNAGDVVEANGVIGEVVRKGTNYLSFVDKDGKVFHKGVDKSIMIEYLKTAKMIGLGANSIRDKRVYHNYLTDILKMIPNNIYVHLFGVMFMELMLKYNEKLSSCDSTSVIRQSAFNTTVSYTGIGKACIGGTSRISPKEALKLHEYTLYRYVQLQEQLDEVMIKNGRVQH